MNTYIGIDLGGTNIRVAKITREGKILEEVKGESYAQQGPKKVMENMKEMIRSISDYQNCSGIGIGVPGPVDTTKGEMIMSTNLPGFERYPMAQELMDAFNLPTYVDNDANVAGLAEALVGAGKGKPIVYYITHSTGIGGALIVNGQVVSGKNGHAGEIGNIIVDRSKKKHNHLNAGAVENESSGTAMIRIAQETIDPNITSAKEIFDLYINSDERATKLVDEMTYNFASAMSAIAHVCDPDLFVIGGGVTKSKDLYFDKLKSDFYSLIHKGMSSIEVKTAILAEPGIIGAAMLPISKGN